MDQLSVNPTLAKGDLLELSPVREPPSILKASQKDNLIQLQTPVHKNLKVQFITPKRTPAPQGSKHPAMLYSTPCLTPTVIRKCDSVTKKLPEIKETFAQPEKESAEKELGGARKKTCATTSEINTTPAKAANAPNARQPTAADEGGNKYAVFQELEAEQRWKERVEIITKLDHQQYTSCAKECIGDIINKAVDINVAKSDGKRPHQIDMSLNIGTEASFNFGAVTAAAESTPTSQDRNTFTFSNTDWTDGAKILQQEQTLNFDFLEQKTSGDVSDELRKQSLYMKFDPLLEDLAARRSLLLLGRKSDIIDFTGRLTPVPEEAKDDTFASPREPDLLCDSPSEINENVTLDASIIPRGSAGDSVSSISPGLAHVTEPKHNMGIIEVLKYSEEDIQRILTKRRKKWLLEQESSSGRQEAMKSEIQNANVLAEDYQKRYEAELQKNEFRDQKASEEVKKFQRKKAESDKRVGTVSKDLEEMSRRKESLQKVLDNLKTNSAVLRQHAKKYRDERDSWGEKIQRHETSHKTTMEQVTEERDREEATHKAKMSKLMMQMKAMELKANRLQAEYERKKNENSELMKIADDLLKANETGSPRAVFSQARLG